MNTIRCLPVFLVSLIVCPGYSYGMDLDNELELMQTEIHLRTIGQLANGIARVLAQDPAMWLEPSYPQELDGELLGPLQVIVEDLGLQSLDMDPNTYTQGRVAASVSILHAVAANVQELLIHRAYRELDPQYRQDIEAISLEIGNKLDDLRSSLRRELAQA